ncbi:Bacteriophage lambda head decoration protein D [Fulvimarina manganoxydans]|uniref:Bacteriophage lambda head decoration protein D n=1 Tax=Fulvimarina manganoxydans TaxID=937218 RepID=A0A1W1Z4E7_9HYPH|nr:head decoration protein [Fulvimarina manganoxydans]SMC42971.1 Bacteriophage lambda head decoration protein D [Fulvimarina manganoxydans]
MPAILTEGRYASDWLKEYEHDYSVEEVTIVSGAGVVDSGTVVGKITASGKYKPVTVAASDGSENAAGIVMRLVDATSADATAVIVARKAKVVHQGLKYGADVDTSAERAAIHAALGALNPPILVREGA